MKEYIVTVADPKIWDTLWNELTKDGLGDNYVPKRSVQVVNERPFNDYCAHFNLTDEEANELRNDSRILHVELKADLQDDVKKEIIGIRNARYDKSNSTTVSMKNWGLLRCTNKVNPFADGRTSVYGDYKFNLDGRGVDIVIIDTGIDPNHPEFAVNPDGSGGTRVVDFDWHSLGVPGCPTSEQIGGYLGDSDGHGSNCASIAAGNTCGWAAGANLYSIRIFDGANMSTGQYLDAIDSDIAFDLVRAFHLAKKAAGNNRPTICSNSWGYSTTYGGMQYTIWRGTKYDNTSPNAGYGQVNYRHPYSVGYITASVENAAAAGVIFVGAAGNYYHKIDVPGGVDYNNYYYWAYGSYTENVYYHRGGSPTNAPSMITVGAVDNSAIERKAYFSESGPRVDIYAPGVMIMGAYASRPYQTFAVADIRQGGFFLNKISGTSQAAPQVAGAVACLLQARPNITVDDAKRWLSANAITNALQEGADPSYSNVNGLQGGANHMLYMPFNGNDRGGIRSA